MAEKRIRCWVHEVNGGTINACSIDEDGVEFSFALSIDMVAKADLSLVVPGAYFVIVGDAGSDARVEFSREVWTKEDIERVHAEAEKLAHLFGKENDD